MVNFGTYETEKVAALKEKAKDKTLTFEEECWLSIAESLAVIAGKIGRKIL